VNTISGSCDRFTPFVQFRGEYAVVGNIHLGDVCCLVVLVGTTGHGIGGNFCKVVFPVVT
jgi:hypothetical protein